MRFLDSVGRSENPSLPELLFQQYRSKGIRATDVDKSVYEVQTAIWVAENANQYAFRPYPELSPLVLEYIRARTNGVREARDPALHRRVGSWTVAIRYLIEQNTADHSLLLWCRERLLEKKLTKLVDILEVKSVEYLTLPPPYLAIATRCQIMDAREKDMGAG